jgi:ribosome-associated toxin RatA of RatAB toxin-antitoxin module
MPRYETIDYYPHPLDRVFDFYRRPANLTRAAPAELNLHVVEAPEVLEVSSRVVVQVRRWGFSQRIVSEVTALELNAALAQEQREGPFRKWMQSQRFRAAPEGGTEVTFTIDFEPPGGMLGLFLTTARIEEDLTKLAEYRETKVRELLAPTS